MTDNRYRAQWRLDPELVDSVKVLAEVEGVTLTEYIERVLRAHVEAASKDPAVQDRVAREFTARAARFGVHLAGDDGG